MYPSQACWRSEEGVACQFAKMTSNRARVNSVKEQIRIREIVFGWNDVHISWSKNGRDFTGEELKDQFIDIFLSVETRRSIPPETKVNFPSRGE